MIMSWQCLDQSQGCINPSWAPLTTLATIVYAECTWRELCDWFTYAAIQKGRIPLARGDSRLSEDTKCAGVPYDQMSMAYE